MRKNKYGTGRGWFNEPKRHALARKGIKTTDKSRRMSYVPRNTWNQRKFDRLSRAEQRGNIIPLEDALNVQS